MRTMERYTQNLHIDGNKVISYDTHVATIDSTNRKLLVHGYWSQTTSKHINYVADTYHLIKEKADRTEPEDKDNGMGMLKAVAMVCKFGEILCTTPEDQNKWKKRMIGTIPGIDLPADFDTLPEEEKTRRLNGAIGIITE